MRKSATLSLQGVSVIEARVVIGYALVALMIVAAIVGAYLLWYNSALQKHRREERRESKRYHKRDQE